MNVIQETPLFADLFLEVSSAAGEPAFLQEARRAMALSYGELPAPRYERSDVSRRNLEAFAVRSAEAPGDWRTLAEPFMGADDTHPLLVVADGHVVYERALDLHASQGVVFTSLRRAARQHEELVRRHLGRAVGADDRLFALNGALWRDGVFLYLPRGVVVKEPLQFICVTTGAGFGTFPRNLIVAQAESGCTFLDAYTAPADLADELHVGVTEAVVGEHARVKLGTVSEFPRRSTTVVRRRALLARGAEAHWVIGEVGDGFTVSEFGSELLGDGSRSTSHAIAIGNGRAHMDITARMVHTGRFSESDTSARGVMQGRATAVYRGLTQIKKGASGANGQQVEKLLMLSPQSRADAIPMLLIDENDVKCGHAASVGQIDEDQLFYLMSRGISEMEAKRMIVWGFLDPVLAELPTDAVRAAALRAVERKMK